MSITLMICQASIACRYLQERYWTKERRNTDMSKHKVSIETPWIAPNALAGSRCRVYLLPYPMRPGQRPEDLQSRFQQDWKEVALLALDDEREEGGDFESTTCESFFDRTGRDEVTCGMGVAHCKVARLPEGKVCFVEDIPSGYRED